MGKVSSVRNVRTNTALISFCRSYYARPESSAFTKSDSEKRLSTSTDRISLNIPRNRPRDRRRSELGFRSARPGELDLAYLRGDPTRRITKDWSPHLWHDRTSLGRQRSIFIAPSVDEEAEGNALTRRNAQIVLFALGFIFPPGIYRIVPISSLADDSQHGGLALF